MPYELDEIDIAITRLLAKNARMSNSEIGKRVGISNSTVRRRIDKMLNERCIRLLTVITPESLGLDLWIHFQLNVMPAEAENVCQSLTEMPATGMISLNTGRFNVSGEAMFTTKYELYEFLMNTVPSLPGVREIDSSIILKIFGYARTPVEPNDIEAP